jgi:hypothetical protein
MLGWFVVYSAHPYYKGQQFSAFKTVYPAVVVTWLTFGLFYAKATVARFADRRFVMRDPALHLLLLGKALSKGKFWRTAKNRRVKTTLLGILVKAFFTPLMIGFFAGHISTISRVWLTHKHLAPFNANIPAGAGLGTSVSVWSQEVTRRLPELTPTLDDLRFFLRPWRWNRSDWSFSLDLFYNVIFAVDCGWATLGYSTDSRWLNNKTKSVEPTAFGWAVCLACYPPFNNVLGTYLPLENGPNLITNSNVLLGLRTAVVVLFAIYASATVSFGMRFSNLTHRGIICRGLPLRLQRAPSFRSSSSESRAV